MKAYGFTVKNWKDLRRLLRPTEDSYGISYRGNIVAVSVADGITRDPVARDFPDTKDLRGKVDDLLIFNIGYPRPSPAKDVADLFTSGFSLYATSHRVTDGGVIRNIFDRLNRGPIGSFNRKIGITPQTANYAERDFAGCVACGAVIRKGKVFYGYIGDCGFAVINRNGRVAKTNNEVPSKRIDEDLKERFGLEFRQRKGRQKVRKVYRNNLDEELSYGALTGEPNALEYVRAGSFELNYGDVPIVFSDGLEDVVVTKDFRELVRQRDFRELKRLCRSQVKTEGTLVYVV